MRILEIRDPQDIKEIFKNLKVDPYGIRIMLPKAVSNLIYIEKLSSICAHILKQQMLSLGGDVAVSRNSLTGKDKTTGCLIMGNLRQYAQLIQKLKRQPFGLDRLSGDLARVLTNYQKNKFTLKLGNYRFNLYNKKVLIMGIVNLTPDSFSGDGLYHKPFNYILDYVQKMVEDGADIIDIGGQSSRPGAKPVEVKEEIKRTIPVIKKLSKILKVPLSIDTYRPLVASRALENGASIVNDITGLRNPQMLKVLKNYPCGIVIMHMKGMPSTMQINPTYRSLVDEIIGFLSKAVDKAISAGVEAERIIIDPGIGFGKTLEHNLLLLRALGELRILGRPILVGPSRKSFIGKILDLEEPKERLYGTLASVCCAVLNGASIMRVHDVKETKQVLRILESISQVPYV